ncbi:MAG: helix-turn-helix transcriptional regulator [Lachnospiraceae bacterium]|nr:helix-turn-helix transcriptional regulator [Lachnospiraceae bacterium]
MDNKSDKDFIIKADDEQLILLEHQLIDNMVSIREEQGLSQAELAKKCNIKQPVIARMEKAAHSPQIDSLLKVLVPMGYTLQIVPLHKKE